MFEDNSEESTDLENKNLSKYSKVWEKIREDINVKASEYVPQLFEALKQDGHDPKSARDKIKRDCFNIWKVETIDKFIPQEAKEIIKVLAGQKGGIQKSKIVLDSHSSRNKPKPDKKVMDDLNQKYLQEQKEKEDLKQQLKLLQEQPKQVYQEKEEYKQFRDEKAIVEPPKPITTNYRFTAHFGGKTANYILILKDNKIIEVIPENKYVRYDMIEVA